MSAAVAGLSYHSRFQVLTEGQPAWATDEKGTSYRFDGFCFLRRRRRAHVYSIVPSWQTPAWGWLCLSECRCPAIDAALLWAPLEPDKPLPDLAA